jgi:hypothetical protein
MMNHRKSQPMTSSTAYVVLMAVAGFVFGIPLFSDAPVCRAEEPPAITIQEIREQSSNGMLTVKQNTSNLQVNEGSVSRNVSAEFNNSRVSGIMNMNEASGFGINQGSVIRVDVAVNNQIPVLLPQMKLLEMTSLANDSLTSSNCEYSTILSGHGFQGSGVMAINQTSGNMNNQLTTIGVSLGNHLPAISPMTSIAAFMNTASDPGISAAILSTDQLKTITATFNNTLDVAKQKASTTVEEGTFQNFSGICAVSQIAGNMNQVTNNLNVNVNTR